MISLQLSNQKDFTSKLFGQEVFDNFVVVEAGFVTAFKTEIHCSSASAPETPPVTWASIRPIAYRILQGSQLPRKFRIVLKLSNENTAKTVRSFGIEAEEDDMPALFINILYEREMLFVVTGCSRRSFSLDRTIDDAWDVTVKKYLKSKLIDFEEPG